jgi:alpha-amylase/alpha-mannosidase (GH57 family)
MEKIYLSFLWHMHQPFYKNLFTGDYLLPWVLLHGTKDYFDMAYILKEFPGLKQNFNLVPSLLRQLMDYEDLQTKDV